MIDLQKKYIDSYISIEDENSSTKIYFEKDNKEYIIRKTDKTSGHFESSDAYEYKIDKNDTVTIQHRTITKCIEDHKKNFSIRNGVVLEADLIRRKINPEVIEWYKELVEWKKLEDYDIFFFICRLHPDIIPESEWKKKASLEIEKIKTIKECIEKLISENIANKKEEYIISNYEHIYFDENSDKYVGISVYEYLSHARNIKKLNDILDEIVESETEPNKVEIKKYITNNDNIIDSYSIYFKIILVLIVLILLKALIL